ncbi:hypothetical protein C1645_805252 [Glomus cerebriforme]|uniref:Uncharacterized protein n=1 Tax=Glomus cerebriforme TaxID=658196 RepID=A0A397SZ30_9GLOM|nr:hypothetical protein C1645_805252 [Glomus cerebriforme]
MVLKTRIDPDDVERFRTPCLRNGLGIPASLRNAINCSYFFFFTRTGGRLNLNSLGTSGRLNSLSLRNWRVAQFEFFRNATKPFLFFFFFTGTGGRLNSVSLDQVKHLGFL